MEVGEFPYLDTPLGDEITFAEHDDTLTYTRHSERGRSGIMFRELYTFCAPSAQLS